MGITVQNDLDLTRKILESIRARQDVWPKEVSMPDYDPAVVARHVERLHDDGLVEGPSIRLYENPSKNVQVRDLTSAGHEFLSAMESGDVWTKLKSALSPTELSAMSLRELASIAKELAVQAARRKLGLE